MNHDETTPKEKRSQNTEPHNSDETKKKRNNKIKQKPAQEVRNDFKKKKHICYSLLKQQEP